LDHHPSGTNRSHFQKNVAVGLFLKLKRKSKRRIRIVSFLQEIQGSSKQCDGISVQLLYATRNRTQDGFVVCVYERKIQKQM